LFAAVQPRAPWGRKQDLLVCEFLKKKNSLSLCTEWRIAIFAKRGKTQRGERLMKEKKTKKKTKKSGKDWIEIEPPTDLKQIFDAVHADINAALKRLGDATQKLKVLKKTVEELDGEDEWASARGR
jgi:hypothetical protein